MKVIQLEQAIAQRKRSIQDMEVQAVIVREQEAAELKV